MVHDTYDTKIAFFLFCKSRFRKFTNTRHLFVEWRMFTRRHSYLPHITPVKSVHECLYVWPPTRASHYAIETTKQRLKF